MGSHRSPYLLSVPVPIVISAKDFQILGGGGAASPYWLDVVDLQVHSASAYFP